MTCCTRGIMVSQILALSWRRVLDADCKLLREAFGLPHMRAR